MKYFWSKGRYYILAVMCCLIFACVSVQGLYRDPSFTYASVQQHNIGVVGVVSVPRKLSHREQTACAGLLHAALVEKYPGMDIMPAGDAVRAIGVSSYRKMMRYYRENGVVQSRYLAALQRHVTHMRYLVFARILEDRVTHSRQTYEQPHNTDEIDFRTTLSLTVHLDVYDVALRRIVWSGSVANSTSHANSYKVASMRSYRHESLNREIVQDVASVVSRQAVEHQHEYPSVPSFKGFMQTVFAELLTRFPKHP